MSSGLRHVTPSGIHPGPKVSSTSSAKSALSLATQVTGGGGARTDTGTSAVVAMAAASSQASSIPM